MLLPLRLNQRLRPFGPTPISELLPNAVLRVQLRAGRAAVPASTSRGKNYLAITRTGTSRSLYRTSFFCGILSNAPADRLLHTIVPDQRVTGGLSSTLPSL